LALADPVAVGEAGDQALVEATAGAVVDVFEAGIALLELGLAQQAIEATRVAPTALAIDQQAEPVFERQFVAGRQAALLFQCTSHAVELEGA